MKLAIKLSFSKGCFMKPRSGSWSCRSGLAVFCRSHWFLHGHCCDFGHVWTAALGLIGVNSYPPPPPPLFFLFLRKKKLKVRCWMYLQDDHPSTCSPNKDALSHIYFLFLFVWLWSRLFSLQNHSHHQILSSEFDTLLSKTLVGFFFFSFCFSSYN